MVLDFERAKSALNKSASLQSQVPGGRLIYVLGSGSMAKKVRELLKSEFELESKALEIEVGSPSSVIPHTTLRSKDLSSDDLVVIGSHSEFSYSTEKIRLLIRNSDVRVIPFETFVKCLSERESTLQNYMLTSDSKIRSAIGNQFDGIRHHFTDELSREVFDAFVDYTRNLERDHENYGVTPIGEILLEGVQTKNRKDSLSQIVEVGAFTGEEILGWLEKSPNWSYLGLEPNLTSYLKLVESLQLSNVKGLALNLAAGDRRGFVRVTGLDASAVTKYEFAPTREEILTQAVPLDDLHLTANAAIIRMDVEGAEAAVLRGARNTIRASKPVLQIAVYHRPFDLPDILAYTKSLGYSTFRLRVHREDFFDTFLYCYAQVR